MSKIIVCCKCNKNLGVIESGSRLRKDFMSICSPCFSLHSLKNKQESSKIPNDFEDLFNGIFRK